MLVNLINIAYCAMKILPYQDNSLSKYCNESTQEIHFVLNERIQQEVFLARFAKNMKIGKKSIWIIDIAKWWGNQKQKQI